MTDNTTPQKSWTGRAWDGLKKLFGSAVPDDQGQNQNQNQNHGTTDTTNQDNAPKPIPNLSPGFMESFLEQIRLNFVRQLNNTSAGNRVLFPMMYYVYLHENDFDQYHEYFPNYLNEIVSMFHQEIAAKCKALVKAGRNASKIDYSPVSPNWAFIFCRTDNGENLTDSGTIVKIDKPGQIVVMSSALPPKAPEKGSNDSSIRMSQTLQQSTQNDIVDINIYALLNVIDLGGGLKKVKFDSKLDGSLGPEFTVPVVSNVPVYDPKQDREKPTISPVPTPTPNPKPNQVPNPNPNTNRNPNPVAPQTGKAKLTFKLGGSNFERIIESGNLLVTSISDTLTEGPNVLKVSLGEKYKSNLFQIKYQEGKWLLIPFVDLILDKWQKKGGTPANPTAYPLKEESQIVIGGTIFFFELIG